MGWRDDSIQQELAKELEQALGDEQKLNAVLTRQLSLRVALPLRRFVDEALAAYIAPYDYSYNQLTRAIAEQSGGAHEDEAIEEGLAAMRNFHIGGDHSHIRVLISFADTILRAGLEFLAFMATNHGYQLQRLQFSSANPITFWSNDHWKNVAIRRSWHCLRCCRRTNLGTESDEVACLTARFHLLGRAGRAISGQFAEP